MEYPSPNFGPRRGAMRPSLIVLHYTAMQSFDEAFERLCAPAYEVSAHWLLCESGHAQPLVRESERAWHAGAGSWGRADDVNSASIGIELANNGFSPFSAPQMHALETLLRRIMDEWHIAPHRVIAHSDLAPERKIDPGPRFDWRRLALMNLSIWPRAPAPPPAPLETFYDNLRRFGYPQADKLALLRAFRVRFRPWHQGPLDAHDAALAADLAARFAIDDAPPSA